MPEQKTVEKINQLRRQMIFHSILYYRMDAPLWSDARFDERAAELVRLQAENPDLRTGFRDEEFAGFDGSTGFDLPLDDEQVNRAVASAVKAGWAGQQ